MFKRSVTIFSILFFLFLMTGNGQDKKFYFVTNFDSIPQPHGVVVDKAGNIWYGSYSDSMGIRVLRPNGIPMPFSPIYELTVGGTKYNVAKNNRGLTLDQNGNILVGIGSRLFRINSQNGTGMTTKNFISSITKPAVDANGRIYVDIINTSGAFYILNSNFDSIGVVTKTAPVWSRAVEVTPDGKDVYMGCLWEHVVPHFHSDNLTQYILKDSLPGPFEGDLPGTNFDKEGRLWISEYQAGRGFDKIFIYNLTTGKRDSLMGYGQNLILSPRGVNFSSSGDTAYVASFDGGVIQKWVRSSMLSALFDNFDDGDNTSNWNTRWSIFSDGATGTWSKPAPGDSVRFAGGANNSPYCAYLKGAMFSWGLGLYADLNMDGTPKNISQFNGLSFYAKGTAHPIRLVFREQKRFDDGAYDFYNYVFTPTPNWKKYDILFPDSLTQMWADPTSAEPFTLEDIVGFDFRPFKTKDTVEVYVDDIKFSSYLTSVRSYDQLANKRTEYTLYQNYPNPFNPSTTIQFSLLSAQQVNLEIYNLLGQRICTLINQLQNSGSHSIVWNGKDQFGKNVPSGVYFYSLRIGSELLTKKMVMMK